MSFCRIRCCASAIGLALAALCAFQSPARADAINVDQFFAAFVNDCEFSADLKTFIDDLFKRYGFDDPKHRLTTKVRIPEALKPAVGKAVATDKGQWTLILVPVDALFHGLKTSAFEFDGGHSNGISVATLILDEPLKDLETALGRTVRETDKRLTATLRKDPSANVGMAPRIKPLGSRSQLICDWSN